MITDIAWNTKRLFPFDAAQPDLNGADPDRGQLGFGTVPDFACAPRGPKGTSKLTGWQPIIKSLGYVTLNTETVHDVRMQFSERQITDRGTKGGATLTVPQRWSQVIFDEPAVRFVYLVNLPVPMSEESGNPFNLQIITNGRVDPSTIVCDWAWARFVLSISAVTQAKLAASFLEQLKAAARDLVGGIRGG